jgi:hypothetical protein
MPLTTLLPPIQHSGLEMARAQRRIGIMDDTTYRKVTILPATLTLKRGKSLQAERVVTVPRDLQWEAAICPPR